MEPPGFEMLQQIGDDIKATQAAWSRFAEFNDAKKDIGN